MAERIEYCPMHEERPKRPMNQNPLNPKVSTPKICPSCKAIYGQMLSEVIAAGKVKVLSPGKSALDREAQQESLFNPHRAKKPKANRPKPWPP